EKGLEVRRVLFRLAWLASNSEGKNLRGGGLSLHSLQPRPRYERGGQPSLPSMYTERADPGQRVAPPTGSEAVSLRRKQGYPSIRLHASEMGRRVYSNLGFKRSWEMKMDFRQQSKSRKSRRAKR